MCLWELIHIVGQREKQILFSNKLRHHCRLICRHHLLLFLKYYNKNEFSQFFQKKKNKISLPKRFIIRFRSRPIFGENEYVYPSQESHNIFKNIINKTNKTEISN